MTCGRSKLFNFKHPDCVRARVYGVGARVYGEGARVHGTLKILVSAPVPLLGTYRVFNWVGLGWVWAWGFWGLGLDNKLSALVHFIGCALHSKENK